MLSDSCLTVCPVLSCPDLPVLPVCNDAILWPNGWMNRDETWRAGRPRPWPHCVVWGPSSPSPKGHSPAIFSPHLLWPMAGWINMPLGREIGLDPSNILLDKDPAPLPKRGQNPPFFGPCLLWANGWVDQDATWIGGRHRPRWHCVRWGPSSPPTKRWQPPIFQLMSVVAKRLDGPRCHLVRRYASAQATLC